MGMGSLDRRCCIERTSCRSAATSFAISFALACSDGLRGFGLTTGVDLLGDQVPSGMADPIGLVAVECPCSDSDERMAGESNSSMGQIEGDRSLGEARPDEDEEDASSWSEAVETTKDGGVDASENVIDLGDEALLEAADEAIRCESGAKRKTSLADEFDE